MGAARQLFVWLILLVSNICHASDIYIISDLNGRYGSTEYNQRVHRAVAQIVEARPDLVLIAGDMVAGQNLRLGPGDLDAMWAAFDQAVFEPLRAAGIPVAVTPGNHDGSALRGFEAEAARFRAQWQDRGSELELLDGSDWPRRYALRMDDLLVVSIDGTRPGPLPESEREFLEGMLSRNASATGNTLVLSHLPLWPLAEGRQREVIEDPKLLGLLHEYGVDAFISGHHHLFWSGVDGAGMLHLATGSLGGSTRAFADGTPRQPFSMARLRTEPGRLHVSTYAEPDFASGLDPAAMPKTVSGPLGTLRFSLETGTATVPAASAGFPSEGAGPLQEGLESLLDEQGLMRAVENRRLALALVRLHVDQAPELAMVNGHEMMYAASLPKIAILYGAAVSLDQDRIESDTQLEKDLQDMIRVSCNACATRVLERIGRDWLLELLENGPHRLYDPQTGGGLWVGKDYARGRAYRRDPLRGTSHGATAWQAARFYYLLQAGELASAERTQLMLDALARPAIKHKFVRGLAGKDFDRMHRKSGTWRQHHADSVMVISGSEAYILVALAQDSRAGSWLERLAPKLHDLALERS